MRVTIAYPTDSDHEALAKAAEQYRQASDEQRAALMTAVHLYQTTALSSREVADAMGVSPAAISRYANGSRSM